MILEYAAGAALVLAMLKGPQVLKVTGRAQFAQQFRDAARLADLRGIPIDYMLSVAALETGWGTGKVFQNTNNLFSITAGSSWRGVTFKASTGFVFRVYNSWSESISDFTRLISSSKLYSSAYSFAKAGNSSAFFGALQKAGYAGSDLAYAEKLGRTLGALV